MNNAALSQLRRTAVITTTAVMMRFKPKSLKNVAGKKTHIFLMIDIGPNSSDLAVTYCSMLEMLMDNAEVKIEKLCVQLEDMMKRTMYICIPSCGPDSNKASALLPTVDWCFRSWLFGLKTPSNLMMIKIIGDNISRMGNRIKSIILSRIFPSGLL